MKIELGNIKRNSKTTLDVEVIVDGRLIGLHRFNKEWSSHSITEEEVMDSEELLYIFQESKVLINNLRRKLS